MTAPHSGSCLDSDGQLGATEPYFWTWGPLAAELSSLSKGLAGVLGAVITEDRNVKIPATLLCQKTQERQRRLDRGDMVALLDLQ